MLVCCFPALRLITVRCVLSWYIGYVSNLCNFFHCESLVHETAERKIHFPQILSAWRFARMAAPFLAAFRTENQCLCAAVLLLGGIWWYIIMSNLLLCIIHHALYVLTHSLPLTFLRWCIFCCSRGLWASNLCIGAASQCGSAIDN